MVKPLSHRDFRSKRYILEDKDFGLVEKYSKCLQLENILGERISKENWKHITRLTDTAIIQTTSVHGKQINKMCEINAEWNSIGGGIMLDDNDQEREYYNKNLSNLLFFLDEEMEACIFSILHGFYRQGLTVLRSVLEKAVGICLQQAGKKFKRYGDFRKNLCEIPDYLYIEDKESIYSLYCLLSSYTHPEVENNMLWKSNGPIYDRITFLDCFILFIICNNISVYLIGIFFFRNSDEITNKHFLSKMYKLLNSASTDISKDNFELLVNGNSILKNEKEEIKKWFYFEQQNN